MLANVAYLVTNIVESIEKIVRNRYTGHIFFYEEHDRTYVFVFWSFAWVFLVVFLGFLVVFVFLMFSRFFCFVLLFSCCFLVF